MSSSTLYSQTPSAIITFGVSKEQHTSIQSSNVSGFHILYLLHIQLMDIWFTSWNTLISILFVDRYMYTCLFSWNNGIWLYIMEELNRQQKNPSYNRKGQLELWLVQALEHHVNCISEITINMSLQYILSIMRFLRENLEIYTLNSTLHGFNIISKL